MPQRSAEEIRQSIENNRNELAVSVQTFRGELERATDWRGHLERHKREVAIGAAVAGFVLAGGVAALGGAFRRRRRG
jgi:hypothetical protein